MTGGSDSDAVRRASLRKQKEVFREKELLIRNALNSLSVDGSKNKKIIFDDSIEDHDDHEEGNVKKSKKRTLFDDDGEESDSREEEFDFSDKKKAKVVNLGNDPRFAMDKRFLEDEDEQEHEEKKNEDDEDEMTNEKNKQLEILENVLGKPLSKRYDTQVAVKRKTQMIRYDPTQEDHQKHELPKEQPQPSKKKKRKVNEAKVEEEKPIPVSNEIFYSVSEKLTEALKAPEEFSLLQRFGTAPPEKTTDQNDGKQSSERKSKFGENFNAKNPFRYDSSDDEDENQEKKDQSKGIDDEKSSSTAEDKFFIDESIFKEAEEFFKPHPTSNESFKKLRRELKEIVRSKIRKNTRKTQSWKRKKINSVKSKRK